MNGKANAVTSSRWVIRQKLLQFVTSEKVNEEKQLEVSANSGSELTTIDELEIDWNPTREDLTDIVSSSSLNTIARTSTDRTSTPAREGLMPPSIDAPVNTDEGLTTTNSDSPSIGHNRPLKIKTFPKLKSPQTRRHVFTATAATSTNKKGRVKSAKRRDTLVSIQPEDAGATVLAKKSSSTELAISTSSEENNYNPYKSRRQSAPGRNSRRRTSVTFGDMPKHIPTGIGRRVKPRYSDPQDTEHPSLSELSKSITRKKAKRRQSESDVVFQQVTDTATRRRRSSLDTERVGNSDDNVEEQLDPVRNSQVGGRNNSSIDRSAARDYYDEEYYNSQSLHKSNSTGNGVASQRTSLSGQRSTTETNHNTMNPVNGSMKLQKWTSEPEASFLRHDILTDFKAMKSESSRPINYPLTEEEREMLELDKLYVDISTEQGDDIVHSASLDRNLPSEISTDVDNTPIRDRDNTPIRDRGHKFKKIVELIESKSSDTSTKEKRPKKDKKAKRDKERDKERDKARDKERDRYSNFGDKPSKPDGYMTQENSDLEILQYNENKSKT